MRARFLLIHNPLAGIRGNRLTRRVITQLNSLRAHVTQVKEQTVKSATSSVARILGTEKFDAAVVAGGDGTVRAFARQIADHGIPMGLIPAGTGNVLAHEIKSPFNPREIAQALINAPDIKISGSRINGQPFFLMAGVGFDGDAIARLNVHAKQRIGKPAYLWPVIRALSNRPQKLDVEIDGTMHKATWVIAARASHYAGSFLLDDKADLRTPGMIAILFNASTRRARVKELAALALGRLDDLGGVKRIACTQINVTSSTPVAAQADGDPMSTTPVEISTRHAPLRLIVPHHYARATLRQAKTGKNETNDLD